MKKFYIPVVSQIVLKQALENPTKKYQEKETTKYKIVRNPGYRYQLVENK